MELLALYILTFCYNSFMVFIMKPCAAINVMKAFALNSCFFWSIFLTIQYQCLKRSCKQQNKRMLVSFMMACKCGRFEK